MSITVYCDENYKNLCSEKTLQSNKKGFFLDFANYIEDIVGDDWIQNIFGKLRNDEERIQLINKTTQTSREISSFLSNVQEVYRKKSSEISNKLRNEAETCLNNMNYDKALLCYSQSLMRAPRSDISNKTNMSLALALWGRSQVLLKLNNPSLALRDIQQSMKEGLPDTYKGETFWRMTICYKMLQEDQKANVSLNLAKQFKTNPEKLQRLENEMKQSFKADVHNLAESTNFPTISESPNKTYPNASVKIEIENSAELGKHAIAAKPINTGDVLVVEPPYAAVLLPEMSGTHCHHCFQRLVAPFGCYDCSNVAFCGPDCRNKAVQSYHKYECKFLDLLTGSGMSILGYLALRMITQNELNRNKEIFSNRDREHIYSLCTNAHLRKPRDFLQRTLMASFLLRILQRSGYFGLNHVDNVHPKSEDEYIIGQMLLFNLQILQFNAHEVYETRHSAEHRFKSAKAIYIGVAIYPTVAFFNHDCLPSTTRHFVGKSIVIRASRYIEPKEVVAENYGPVFIQKTLKERQIWLSSRYWFTCKCNACIFDWPTLNNGLDRVSKRIRCPTNLCTHLFTLPVRSEPVNCPTCEKNVCLTDRILLLNWCEEQYAIGADFFRDQKVQEAIDVCCIAIDTFYRISAAPHQQTHLAEGCLRACFADFGNVAKI